MIGRGWAGAVVLSAIGVLQLSGDLLGLPAAKGIGAAIAASPAPKVFTAHQGFETYSSVFVLAWSESGRTHEIELTPGRYHGVRGPYNRRNAYGAALSYAPVLQSNALTKPMHDAVLHYAFCGPSSILAELGIDRQAIAWPLVIELRPRQSLPPEHGWKLRYEVTCDA